MPAASAGKPIMLETNMSSATYRLTRIHRSLDDAIRMELKRKLPDSLRLLRLKKLRLAVKDRLTAMLRRRVAA
jgi:hypothetical protein